MRQISRQIGVRRRRDCFTALAMTSPLISSRTSRSSHWVLWLWGRCVISSAIPARRSSAERPNAQAHQALAGGDGRVASGRRMTNEAMTTSASATTLPAAKIVEYCSPIRSRNGPVPNAATP
jgi:hypothetical protein